MGFKTGLIVGLGTGYVLGARAGRARYEEIRRTWGQITGSPKVQQATQKTREVAGEGAKKGLHAVQRGVEKAGTSVKSRLHRNEEPAETYEGLEATVTVVEEPLEPNIAVVEDPYTSGGRTVEPG